MWTTTKTVIKVIVYGIVAIFVFNVAWHVGRGVDEGTNPAASRISTPVEPAIDEQALIRERKIAIGMSEEGLLASWGKPRKINSSVYASGEHKQYVYQRGTYVYVQNGKVKSWQTSQ